MSFEANIKVATVLAELARYITEAGDKNRAFAFAKAATAIRNHDKDVINLENLKGIKGVGPSTIAMATEILSTGTCARLTELKAQYNIPDLTELEKIPGVGPVKAKKIYGEFGIKTLVELRQIVDSGIFTDSKVIDGLSFVERSAEYTPRPWAELAGRPMLEILWPFAYHNQITFAGSIRRKKDLVRDIDILICCECSPEVIYNAIRADGRFIVQYGGQQKIRVEYKVYHGITMDSHVMGGDIVITTPKEWPFALCYLTGSKDFAPGLRGHALSCGYTLNEHRLASIYDATGNRLPEDVEGAHVEGITTEQELFAFLNIPYVPPECRRTREDAGKDFSEILNEMPEGELHTHTAEWSDGSQSVVAAVATAKMGSYTFYGISDHTKALPHGVAPDQLAKYAQGIHDAGAEFGIDTCVGLELDINAAHQIVYPYEALKPHMDYVILAIHSAIGTNMVSRYLAAIEQIKDIPAIMAHVTGRLFGTRDIPEADWATLFMKCAKKNILIELNGQPDRLDPPTDLIQLARALGCRFILSTDHHGGDTKSILRDAWYMARAAGLSRDAVVLTGRDVAEWMQDVMENS